MDTKEKRMIENWEVKQAFRIGRTEIVLGEDASNLETPFVVSDCNTYSELGFCEYSNIIGTDDYLEAVEEYTKRITAETEHVRQERRERGVDNAPLTIGACSATGRDLDITNKLVIIKADALRAEYRGADHQYFLAESGFGCAANSRGNAVYGRNLYTGEKARWERYDVLGAAAPDKLPLWAKERLKQLQPEMPATSPSQTKQRGKNRDVR